MTPSTSTSCARTPPARSRASSNRGDSRSSTSCRAHRRPARCSAPCSSSASAAAADSFFSEAKQSHSGLFATENVGELAEPFRLAAQPIPQGELLDLAGRRTRELLDRAQLLGPLLAGEAGGVEVGAYGVEGRQLAEIG